MVFKIAIASYGSLGDIHPYMAIAQEFKKRGKKVIFATNAFYKSKIEREGLEFMPVRPDLSQIKIDEVENLIERSLSPKGTKHIMESLILPNLKNIYEDILRATQSCDAILSHITYAPVAAMVYHKTKIPWISSSMSPLFHFSSHERSILSTEWGNVQLTPFPSVNSLLLGTARLATMPWAYRINLIRSELNLPWVGDPLFNDAISPLLDLGIYSPSIAAYQPDFPPQRQITGCCFYDNHLDHQNIPEELLEFLNQGTSPFIFSLGSAAAFIGEDFFRESAKAVMDMGERAILLTSENPKNIPYTYLSNNIRAYQYIPQSLIFPYGKAIIHAGGIMTLSQCLHSGKPSLIVPFGQDQFDNAYRAKQLQVATILNKEDYQANNVIQKLKELLSPENKYLETASEISKTVKMEDGAKKACDLIENILVRYQRQN